MSKTRNVIIIILVGLLTFTSGIITGLTLKSCEGDDENTISSTTDIPVSTLGEEATDTTTVQQNEADMSDNFSEIIDNMTLEEKVAQMMMVSCHSNIDINDASEFGVGGICFYAFSFEDKTEDEVIVMIDNYQSLSPIPMLVSTDEEGGTVNRVSLNPNLRAVPFWSPSELFSFGGMEFVRSDTEEKADLLLSLGINVNLAPVCDVPLSEDNYIYDRCFSLDADETAEYVSEVVSVMEQKHLGSTLKHFPGYGGSIDTHQYVSYDYRDYNDFKNADFKPFIAGIEQGADCVMVSHNIVTCMDDEKPASLSKNVHDILRNELGFNGVIMTDDLSMDGITEFTDGNDAAVSAVLAGNDMLACEDYRGATDAIIKAVEDGIISEEQIDESVARIFSWKAELGILN